MHRLLQLFLLLLCLCSGCQGQRIRSPAAADVYTRTCDSDLDAGEVLHAYETKNYGCTLVCSILAPSSEKYKEFLNHFALKTHFLSGMQCINETYVGAPGDLVSVTC